MSEERQSERPPASFIAARPKGSVAKPANGGGVPVARENKQPDKAQKIEQSHRAKRISDLDIAEQITLLLSTRSRAKQRQIMRMVARMTQ
jgi:hypothetical protein